MWFLMADQLKKGNVNHPLMMLNKGMEEKGMMPEELKGSAQAFPSIWSQLLR
jgi:hypothetical protein